MSVQDYGRLDGSATKKKFPHLVRDWKAMASRLACSMLVIFLGDNSGDKRNDPVTLESLLLGLRIREVLRSANHHSGCGESENGGWQ